MVRIEGMFKHLIDRLDAVLDDMFCGMINRASAAISFAAAWSFHALSFW